MNYEILHMGLGWPVGTVVPESAMLGGHADHLRIGSVAATSRPATAGHGFVATPTADPTADLKASLRAADGRAATEADRADAAQQKLDTLTVAHAARGAELAAARAELADLREKHEKLRKTAR